MDELAAFVARLAQTEVPDGLYNQYAPGSPANAVRRSNLHRYLQQMREHRPSLLLVGEAAGHRGCRLTGVPFTSEFILLNAVTNHGLFGAGRGYRKTGERPRAVKEQSATIVWSVLARCRALPLLWNALPFHPHRPGRPWSNRTPTPTECHLGDPFLRHIIRLFHIQTVVAVGNKAAHSLQRNGISGPKVRHPSHGGKAAFTGGILTLLEAG